MAKATEKKKDFFWLSYSDLMTSLFFVMLVLFVLVYSMQNNIINTLAAAKEELDEIHKIQAALEKLDNRYFEFDKENMRYKLRVDVNFPPDNSSIHSLDSTTLIGLKNAGTALYNFMTQITKDNPDINYLLVVEGNTQRLLMKNGQWNHEYWPNMGYEFSYQRSLALFNYWKDNGYDFRSFKNCEIMVSGSGYFGKSRESDENRNRRFTIQITPKIGEMKNRLRSGSVALQSTVY